MDFYFHPVHLWIALVEWTSAFRTPEFVVLAAGYGWLLTLPQLPGDDTLLPWTVTLPLHAVFFATLVSYPATFQSVPELEVGLRKISADEGHSDQQAA